MYFTKSANIARLNKAVLYIKQNEFAKHVRVVHVQSEANNLTEMLVESVQVLDTIYPSTRLDCNFVRSEFSGKLAERLSSFWGIPITRMFMSCPSTNPHMSLEGLKGLRIILRHESNDQWKRFTVEDEELPWSRDTTPFSSREPTPLAAQYSRSPSKRQITA